MQPRIGEIFASQRKNVNVFAIVFLIIVLASGCRHSTDPDDLSAPVRTPDWVEDVLTQPVPSWGSRTRLVLPVSVDQIVFGPGGGIGGFGSHQGGHIEGLDHVWLEVVLGIPIRSWADGRVAKIEDMGGEYFVTIQYDGGLQGKHMEVKTPLVSVGQQVKAGDPVAYGLTYGAMQSAEFMLNDANRNDGVTDVYGSNICPFDYLRSDIKAALEAAYQERVVKPYLSLGKDAGNNHPIEPYLTNRVLIHKLHRGTLAGEWLLKSTWAAGGFPDILIFLDVKNPYFSGRKMLACDDNSTGQQVFEGPWTADTSAHTFTFVSGGANYYGVYELNESQSRSTLKIEYRTGSYPAGFSAGAAVYVERAPLARGVDGQQLGVRK